VSGRVALVTGAGRNIGRSIALALADAGFAVAVHVRQSLEEGDAVVAEIRAKGGDAMRFAADVTDPERGHIGTDSEARTDSQKRVAEWLAR